MDDTSVEMESLRTSLRPDADSEFATHEALRGAVDWTLPRTDAGNFAVNTLPEFDLNMEHSPHDLAARSSDSPVASAQFSDASASKGSSAERIQSIDQLEKWMHDRKGQLSQKELADKILEFNEEKEMEWDALREGGYDDMVLGDSFNTQNRLALLILQKISEPDQIQRLKSRLPFLVP